jgi:hypothetical protein
MRGVFHKLAACRYRKLDSAGWTLIPTVQVTPAIVCVPKNKPAIKRFLLFAGRLTIKWGKRRSTNY